MTNDMRLIQRSWVGKPAGGALLAVALMLSGCGGAAPAASSVAPTKASPSPSASTAVSGSAKPAVSASAKPAAAASASAGAIPTVPADKPVSITIATGVPSAVFAPTWIALDTGLFEKHSLKVTLQNIEGVTQTQAIIAGDVQIGNIGGAEILNSRAGGSQLVAIGEATLSPVFEIHAKPSYKRVEDLKGTTIAITRKGSSTDMAARVILSKHGLDPDKDVKLLDTSNMPAILAALVGGSVQAGTMSPPTTIKANAAGFPMVASAVTEHVPLQQNMLSTTKTYADAHPDVIYSYLEAYLDGVRDFFNKPDVAIASIAKHTESDQATAKEAYEAIKPALEVNPLVHEEGLTTVQELGGNAKTRELKLADAHDDVFIKQLDASGYIKNLGVRQS